jgi:hypothetical protein
MASILGADMVEHMESDRFESMVPKDFPVGRLTPLEHVIRITLVLGFIAVLSLEGWLLWQLLRLF